MRTIVLLLVAVLWTSFLSAQSYLHIRSGYSTGRYRPLDKDLLDKDEHDFIGGSMFDVELGKSFGSEKLSILLGAKLQYSQRILKGTYTVDTWDPDADIKAHLSAFFLTLGVKAAINNKLGIITQINGGPTYILWFQSGELKNKMWRYYPPIDFGLEYKLKKDWNLGCGVSAIPPIYLSTTTNYYLGLRKQF